MKKHLFFVAAYFMLFVSSSAFASEVCSQLGGTCRSACGGNEASEAGAFEDCTERQQCCVARAVEPARLQCCIYSFDPKSSGPTNCGLPENNACMKGSGSPASCAALSYCK